MTAEKPPLSQIPPYPVAMLLCDVAIADPATGKKNLLGIFDRLYVGHFPTQHPMTLYLRVTDAEGYYELAVRYVKSGPGQVLAEARGEMHVSDRLAAVDMTLQWPPLPIPEEGRYEFQVWANSMFLGVATFDAVPREQS